MKRGREFWAAVWGRLRGKGGKGRSAGAAADAAVTGGGAGTAGVVGGWQAGGSGHAGRCRDFDNRTSPPVSLGEVVRYQSAPELTFVVQNTGTATLKLGSVRVPSRYSVVDRLVSKLAPYASDLFTVRLTTSYVGTFTGEVKFSTNDADENPFNFAVQGVVKPAVPEIAVYAGAEEIADNRTAPPVEFGSAAQGSPGPTQTFTVRNLGTATLTLGTPQVPGGYTVIEPLVTSLAAGAWDTFTVRLNTATVGTWAGQISFSTNDADENPFNFAITGQVISVGPAPEIAVYGSAGEIADGQTSPLIDFGRADRGAAGPTRTFTVRNQGTAALTLSGVQVPGGYTVVEPLASSLAAGAADTFTVQLNTGAVGTFAGQIVIGNDDADENPFNFSITGRVTAPVVYVSINDVAQAEGDAGETDFTFTVSLSTAVPSGSLTLNYRTEDGSAVADADYRPVSGTLSFGPGETSKTLTVKVLGEKRVETDETFFVWLLVYSNNSTSPVAIQDSQGQGTILNDDYAALSIDDVTVTEGNAGDVAAVFTVSLSQPVDAGSVSVSYSTSDGSAVASQPDYRARSGSVSFAAGATVQTISIPVVGDTVDEWDETFYVTLGLAGSTYVTLADGSGLGLILDDDDPGANENPDVWRILHQSQCFCSTVCESDCQAVSTMDGGFVQELLDWTAELPVYFADATFNAAAAIFNFAVRMPDLGASPDRITVKLDVGTHQGVPQTFPTAGLGTGAVTTFAIADDYSDLATGVHPLKLALQAFRGTELLGQTTLEDQTLLIDLSDSSFGVRWWLPSLDRLFVTPQGAGLVEGGNRAWWFAAGGASAEASAAAPGEASGEATSLATGYQTPDGFFGELLPTDSGYQVRDYQGNVREFDSLGRLRGRIDRNGNRTSYGYDSLGRPTVILDATGRMDRYLYTGSRLSSVRDEAGRETTFGYDALGRLTAVTYPDPDAVAGNRNTPVERFEYDANGRLIVYRAADHAEGDPAASRITRFEYDATGRYRRSVKADGSVWQLTPAQTKGLGGFVPPDELYATATDGGQNVTTVWHDDFGNVTKRVDAQNNVFLWERNSQGLVTRSVLPDPDGGGPLPALVTTYTYDARGNLTSLKSPDFSTQSWQYDPTFSQVTQYRDALGRTTDYTLDAYGNATQVTQRGTSSSAADTALGDASHRWQNPWNRLDANNDGYVSPMDSLVVTNAVNAGGARPLAAPTSGSSPPPYVDVNGDDFLSAADVLEVSNSLKGTATLTTQYVYTDGVNVPGVPRGLLYEETDPLGRKTRYEYGTSGTLPEQGRIAARHFRIRDERCRSDAVHL